MPSNNPNPAQPPEKSYEFKSILLVDDDKQLAMALQWVLADQNFLVDVANDGAEALDKIREHEYDAIVCDLMMPRLRGDQLYLNACGTRPELAGRFIFITGFAADPQIGKFLTESKAKYLMKPFPIANLVTCLNELLA